MELLEGILAVEEADEARMILKELQLMGYQVVFNREVTNVITMRDGRGSLFLLNYGCIDPMERKTKKWWVRNGSRYTSFCLTPEEALQEAVGWIRKGNND